MPIPLQIAHEPVKAIAADTAALNDTLVRASAPDSGPWPTWIVLMLTAASAVVAGVIAQWFRVGLDGLRRREQIRKILLLEINAARSYLALIRTFSESWNIPRSNDPFWLQMDSAIRGFEELYVDIALFPLSERLKVIDWFLGVRVLRHQTAGIADWYAEDSDAGRVRDQIHQGWERRLNKLRDLAIERWQQGAILFELLEKGKPRTRFIKWMLNADQEPQPPSTPTLTPGGKP